MRHSPRLDLFCTAFVVDIAITKLGTDADVRVAQLFKADTVHLAMVLDQLTDDLELIVWANVKVSLHALNDGDIKIL